MRLSAVMRGTGVTGPFGDDPEVQAVTDDSRAVVPGALFFAFRGTRVDGHSFAADAARRGAIAVVAEHPVGCAPARLILSTSSRRAMAIAAANFFGQPGRSMTLAGVTGTNGKTTIAYLFEACAVAAGMPVAMLGTVAHRWPGGSRPATHTTPGAVEIASTLATARDAGARLAVLEVSSHALEQDRVAALTFDAAAFTNLTRDHLDYHGDLESYFLAKRRLFVDRLAPGGVAVVNAADGYGSRLAAELEARAVTVWRHGSVGAGRGRDHAHMGSGPPQLSALHVQSRLGGIDAELATPAGALAIRSPLVGAHNVENLLGAAGLALAAGVPRDAVERGLSSCPGAPGRLERIAARGVTAFVDYAHTADALTRALAALRDLDPSRLVLVFGCGGDRDRGKRPLMGEAAARGADLVVVTSDNPRSEDPSAIIADIVPGVERGGALRLDAEAALAGKQGYLVVPDRREAISVAIAAARPGDAVLIAGKGHENHQIVGAERRPFDDREETRLALGLT